MSDKRFDSGRTTKKLRKRLAQISNLLLNPEKLDAIRHKRHRSLTHTKTGFLFSGKGERRRGRERVNCTPERGFLLISSFVEFTRKTRNYRSRARNSIGKIATRIADDRECLKKKKKQRRETISSSRATRATERLVPVDHRSRIGVATLSPFLSLSPLSRRPHLYLTFSITRHLTRAAVVLVFCSSLGPPNDIAPRSHPRPVSPPSS